MSYKAIWRGDEPLMNAGAAALSEFLGDEARAVGIRKAPDAPANDGETNGAAHSAWMLEAYFEEKPDLQALTKIFALIDEAWTQVKADMPYIPLHHQVIAWAMGDGFDIPISADDRLRVAYVVKK